MGTTTGLIAYISQLLHNDYRTFYKMSAYLGTRTYYKPSDKYIIHKSIAAALFAGIIVKLSTYNNSPKAMLNRIKTTLTKQQKYFVNDLLFAQNLEGEALLEAINDKYIYFQYPCIKFINDLIITKDELVESNIALNEIINADFTEKETKEEALTILEQINKNLDTLHKTMKAIKANSKFLAAVNQ